MRMLLRGTRLRPYLLLVCLAVVWGVHWPVAKIGLRDLPPYTYGVLRVATGLAVILAVLAGRSGRGAAVRSGSGGGIRQVFRRPDRRDLPIVLSVGIGQMAAGIALMNLALPLVSAGRSSILVYTMPLWVAVIQFPVLRSGRGDAGGGAGRQLLGLLAGLAGIALLLNPAAIDWGSSGQLLGSAALLLSAMVWAATTIHLRGHKWHGTPIDLMPWQLLMALVPLVVAAIVLEQGRPIHWEPSAVLAILYSGPLATALAFWLSQSISRSLSPLATTMGFLGVPVVGLASAWLMLGEPLTALDLAGAALTFVGIVVVSVSAGSGERAEGAEGEAAAAGPAVARADP